MEQQYTIQTALVHLLEKGSISLPILLFTEYKRIGLSEKEVMVLIHLILFQEKEQKFFPTMSELRERMTISKEEIIGLLQNLVRGGFLMIHEEINPEGLRCERYSTTPLLQQVVASYIDRTSPEPASTKDMYRNLFHRFEQELGRPLSPLECEALSQWIDDDQYSEDLIDAALREAVYSGKVNFRYIDRILLEWQKNRIRTAQEAIEYSRKFHQKGVLYQPENKIAGSRERVASGFSFYNWVNPQK